MQPIIKYFTSYYGRIGLPVRRCLAITPVIPKDYRGAIERRLAPTSNALKRLGAIRLEPDPDVRNTELSSWQADYFQHIGKKIGPEDAAQLVDGRILLSHESTGIVSHRYLVRHWLEFFGYTVQSGEWGGETEDEIDQRSFPFTQRGNRK